MRTLLVAAAALAAAVTAAEAKCTKKSLNGNWAANVGSAAAVGVMAGGTYNVTVAGTTISFTLTSFNSTKCRGTGNGTFGGASVAVEAASEGIASSSSKPNHLLVTVSVGGNSLMFAMQRQ
jgi:hypothetical protein